MAEQSKSAGAFGRLKRPPGGAGETRSKPGAENGDQQSAMQVVRTTAEAAGRGRRPGKRSDPAFRPTTFFVRKETQRKAARLLEDQDAGKDLSDLVEELLAKWISDNANV
jgi:hypothetical protein